MPAKWQQWMPFHIDRFRGSPAVQAMHPAARCGYLYLLSRQWQSDDCTVSGDAIDLADDSGLGDELWAIHGARILRNFDEIRDGHLRNQVCFEEWLDAKAVFDAGQAEWSDLHESRSKAGKNGAAKRWANNTGRQSTEDATPENSKHASMPSSVNSKRMANDGFTGTGTGTEIHNKEATNVASFEKPKDESRILGTLPLNDGKDFAITDSMVTEWRGLYPAVDVVQECRSMKGWCLANPARRKTQKGIARFIHRWLADKQDKGGVITRGGGNNGSNGGNRSQQRTNGNIEAFERSIGTEEDDQENAPDTGGSTAGCDQLGNLRGLLIAPGRLPN